MPKFNNIDSTHKSILSQIDELDDKIIDLQQKSFAPQPQKRETPEIVQTQIDPKLKKQ